jgi:hypothetical protein
MGTPPRNCKSAPLSPNFQSSKDHQNSKSTENCNCLGVVALSPSRTMFRPRIVSRTRILQGISQLQRRSAIMTSTQKAPERSGLSSPLSRKPAKFRLRPGGLLLHDGFTYLLHRIENWKYVCRELPAQQRPQLIQAAGPFRAPQHRIHGPLTPDASRRK